jgi:hypothetical protein
MIQNSNRKTLHFLIAMKFVLHEDTSFNFTLKFRGGAQHMHLNNILPLNLITAMAVDIKFLIWI